MHRQTPERQLSSPRSRRTPLTRRLPRNDADLNSGHYTQVPVEGREDFLNEHRDKDFFRIYRNAPENPMEAMPFAFYIGNYVGKNTNYGVYDFYNSNDDSSVWIGDTDEIYIIGSTQRGGKTIRRRRRLRKIRKQRKSRKH